MKFGFFDSGMGGVFMMQACLQKFPGHDYVYLGDTKNLPYGPKESLDILTCMEPHILALIVEHQCDHVFIACNTASAQALDLFFEKYPQYKNKVHNIVEMTHNYFTNLGGSLKSTLVLATHRTVASNVYKNLLGSPVYQQEMPGLVDLIESQEYDDGMVLIEYAISYYPDSENILLACTHYIALKKHISKKYPTIEIKGQDEVLINYMQQFPVANVVVGEYEYFITEKNNHYERAFGVPFKII